MPDRILAALEGHDGAGKSSIAAELARRTGATVVKPFSAGLGDYIAHLWGERRFAEADRAARFAIDVALRTPGPLIFDRHWLTMATVLPERYLRAWRPRPTTILCWTDVSTTLARLEARGEDVSDVAYHHYYIPLYRQIADRLAVPVVETTRLSVEDAADAVLALLTAPT